MKKKIIFTVFILFMAITQTSASRKIGSEDFNRVLIRYGDWIELHNRVFVWHPTSVNRDWQPYSDGRWFWTEFGWFWDSYEPFGWITNHYGRWDFDDQFGWIWFPGYKWAPAWVEWRMSDNYIGWLPLSPNAVFDIEDGIYFSSASSLDFAFWSFIKLNHLRLGSLNDYFVKRNRTGSIYKYTESRTNYYLNNGIIICEGFLPEDISRYNIPITNLEFTNDFRKIIEYDIDISVKVHRRPPTPWPNPPTPPRPRPKADMPIYRPLPTTSPVRNPVPPNVRTDRVPVRKPVPEIVVVDHKRQRAEKESKPDKIRKVKINVSR